MHTGSLDLHKSQLLSALVSMVALSGCAGATSTILKKVPERPSNCVFDLYASEREVSSAYETVCIVEAYTGQGVFHDKTLAGAIEEARSKVCECGADAAIIMEGSSKRVSDWTATDLTPAQDLRGNVTLKGIRYKSQ